ncbi:MAG: 3-deoxy-7-phosphoheptulonate synthase [Parvicellaceae bacterium]
MILHLKTNTPKNILKDYCTQTNAFINKKDSFIQIVNSSSYKVANDELNPFVIEAFVFDSDIQLASLKYSAHKQININQLTIGRNSSQFPIIMGPCSVESETQLKEVANFLIHNKLHCIRAGAYKPRTSPYSFQGLETKGLELLKSTAKTNNLITFSEAKDASQIKELIDSVDVVQVGTKAMYDQGILKALGKSDCTVLLKRGFGSTIQEFVQAAEFILCEGNENVILCERGIRTFENKTRFTLDLCGVAWLKHNTNLPIVIDPSHALGSSYAIADLSKAAIAMGVDGLLIETHPNPKQAQSDAEQQLNFDQAKELLEQVQPYLKIQKRTLY